MGDTIKLYCNDSQIMNDAIDRIIVEIHSYKKQFGNKSILLSGCGSKSGTTTIAINLAIALSMSGWKTLLVDCDLRKEKKYKRLNEDIKIGLSDYLSKDIELNEATFNTNYELLEYIPGGSVANSPVRLFCSAKMEQFVSEVKDEYDYIIFDFPSLNIVSDASILFPYVDGIALVGAMNQTTKKQLRDARRKVSSYRDKYYGLIINQVHKTEYKKYIKDYDYFGEQNMTKRFETNLKKKKKDNR